MKQLIDSLYKVVQDLLKIPGIFPCDHEDTHRGGAIWTICNQCGAEFADDEGGVPPYKEPPAIDRALEILKQVDAYRAGKADGIDVDIRLLEVLNTDPWNEHLNGNPIAKELGNRGQCVEVMKNLVRAKFGLPLADTSIKDDKANWYPEVDYEFAG